KDDVKASSFQGASGDHSHLLFVPGHTRTAYLPGDPEPSGAAADRNTYVAHLDSSGQPSLDLLARDSADRVWGGNCGDRFGGVRLATPGANGERNQGAISEDGTRAYFSTRPAQPEAAAGCDSKNKLRILKRLESKTQGVHIEELFQSECQRSDCSSVDGDDFF